VQEALFTYGPNLAVAEKARQAQRAKLGLHVLRVVIGLAEKPMTTPIATA
jgi:hypothetical protein